MNLSNLPPFILFSQTHTLNCLTLFSAQQILKLHETHVFFNYAVIFQRVLSVDRSLPLHLKLIPIIVQQSCSLIISLLMFRYSPFIHTGYTAPQLFRTGHWSRMTSSAVYHPGEMQRSQGATVPSQGQFVVRAQGSNKDEAVVQGSRERKKFIIFLFYSHIFLFIFPCRNFNFWDLSKRFR